MVRREFRGYPNAIALDVGRQNGAVTPAFVPVRTFLNGVDQGNYLLIEHVSPRGWGRSHFGHDDFLMFIDRSQSGDDRSQQRYEQLVTWVETAPSPLSMAAVAEHVDLDNLLRHLFTFIFCGTTDWNQGAAVLDNTAAKTRWFWVHWDLDQRRVRQGRFRFDRIRWDLTCNRRHPEEHGYGQEHDRHTDELEQSSPHLTPLDSLCRIKNLIHPLVLARPPRQTLDR